MCTTGFHDLKCIICNHEVHTKIYDIWLNQIYVRLCLIGLAYNIIIDQYRKTACHYQTKVTFTKPLNLPYYWRRNCDDDGDDDNDYVDDDSDVDMFVCTMC